MYEWVPQIVNDIIGVSNDRAPLSMQYPDEYPLRFRLSLWFSYCTSSGSNLYVTLFFLLLDIKEKVRKTKLSRVLIVPKAHESLKHRPANVYLYWHNYSRLVRLIGSSIEDNKIDIMSNRRFGVFLHSSGRFVSILVIVSVNVTINIDKLLNTQSIP